MISSQAELLINIEFDQSTSLYIEYILVVRSSDLQCSKHMWSHDRVDGVLLIKIFIKLFFINK